MRNRTFARRAAVTALGGVLFACGSAPPIAETREISVAPSAVSLLTCSTEQFKATVQASNDAAVSWSAEDGTIDAHGLYTAPIKVPTGGSDDVTAALNTDETADVTVTLATAHPTPPKAIGGQTNPAQTVGVFNHVVAGNGKNAYAVTSSQATKTKDWSLLLYPSVDGGVTWKTPIDVSDAKDRTIRIDDAVVAVDPVNAKLVYVLYEYETGGGTFAKTSDIDNVGSGNTYVLAASTDGGATFARYVVASADKGHWGTPMDLSAPAENAVVLSIPSSDPVSDTDTTPVFVGIWASPNGGKSFGTAGPNFNGYVAAGLGTPLMGEGDPGSATTPFLDLGFNGGTADGITEGPRLFADGKGKACLTFVAESKHGAATQQRVYVQCSTDNGTTFSKPAVVDPEDVDEETTQPHVPEGAMGPDGAMAIAWYSDDASAGGHSAYVSLSTDAGKVWSKPTKPSAYLAPGDKSAVQTDLDIRYEGSVLWLAYHAGAFQGTDRIAVDKSCDGGKTWSGPQLASGTEGGTLYGLTLPGLYVTGAGLQMSAFGAEKTTGLQTLSLAP